jgi:DNA-directed RNA polymerase III subunit RPC1
MVLREQIGPVQAAAEPTIAFTKKMYRDDPGPRKIKSIQFGVMSAQEMVKVSELHVFERNLYQQPERKPAPNGILDTKLVNYPTLVYIVSSVGFLCVPLVTWE